MDDTATGWPLVPEVVEARTARSATAALILDMDETRGQSVGTLWLFNPEENGGYTLWLFICWWIMVDNGG